MSGFYSNDIIFFSITSLQTMPTKLCSLLPIIPRLLSFSFAFLVWAGFANANPVVYKAGTPSQDKKLVFVASDHEYRAEETLPALARIMAVHHGFDCTVLFLSLIHI